MKTIAAYTALLNSIGYESTDEGIRNIDSGDYVSVNGERLYMPEQKWLVRSDSADRLYFHPLSENIVEPGKSPVFEWLENCIIYTANVRALALMSEMVDVLAHESKISKLTSKLNSFAEACKGADTQRLTFFIKVLESISKTIQENPIYEFRYRRRFEVEGVTYHRVCLIDEAVSSHFENPSVDSNGKPKVLGVRAPSKDKDIKFVQSFLGWFFGDGGMPRKVVAASNSNDAPYFYSLCEGWKSWSDSYNRLVGLFKKFLKDEEGSSYYSDYVIDRSFADIDWTTLVKEIPPQRGNTGTSPGGRASTPAVAQEATVPVVNQPATAVTPAPVQSTAKPLSPSELLASQQMAEADKAIASNLNTAMRTTTVDKLNEILRGGQPQMAGVPFPALQPNGMLNVNPFMAEAQRQNAMNQMQQMQQNNPLAALTNGFNMTNPTMGAPVYGNQPNYGMMQPNTGMLPGGI